MAQQSLSGKQRHWLDLIRLWQQSKLSVRAFCRRHRLSEPSFYCWRRTLQQRGLIGKLPAEDAVKSEAPAFLQVAVDPAAAVAPRSIEVVLANGRRLRVRPGFDANTLRQLLRVLEEPAC
jgi:transposase-like protein